MLRPLGLIRYEPLESLPLNIREVPHFAENGYGRVLAIWKVFTYSQSFAWPDLSDNGYGYV